ncbi:WD40 repeat domain-containing protein [Urbifossiella limnaea]|uniref:WD domain, G-beta repeat n=1 Tax=Urbifossiella limnaea TaxID=2528023 RepID=A0A517XQA6_9BACT|nr:hypothetical protein [Urbifossiella limnaea]QDU19688.1 WD domain, G-beta repeat [Urbifossiella limnaea]
MPNGSRLAVLWDGPPALVEPAPAPGVVAFTQTSLTVIGWPATEPQHYHVSSDRLNPGLLGRNQLVANSAGDILFVDARKHLSWRPRGATPGEQLGQPKLWAVPSVVLGGARLWLAGTGGTVFVASREFDVGYELSRVEPPAVGDRAKVTRVLRGGVKGDLLLCADLHHSGRWFAACHLASDGKKAQLDVWEVGDSPRNTAVKLPCDGACVSIAPDAKVVAIGLTDGRVMLFDTAKGAQASLPVQLGQFTVASVAFHPRGRLLVCGTFDRRGQDNLFVVDPAAGRVVAKFAADPHAIATLCFNADGTRLATFGGAGRVTVWDQAIHGVRLTDSG